ncbi:MAG TPA: AI-2E family transporter [Vicinamibacterales bacterium]|nr:AI-2E family transporter [Vicinamibacterales bacterium]
MTEPRRTIDIAPAAIAKVIAAVVIVWLWLYLWQLVMVVLVAIVIAIGLEPSVAWLERRHISRTVASTAVVVLLTAIVAGFLWITGASLAGQARELGGRISEAQHWLAEKTPSIIKSAVRSSGAPNGPGGLADYVTNAGRMIIEGLVIIALILVLTVYFLIEGRQTYKWLVAYAPPGTRDRVHLTACEARNAIFGYVVGNVVTSVFATVVVFIALTILRVPAALLLALLAGVFDFVPVLGFIFSSVPAVLLALTRSIGVALLVAAIYVAYHAAENYYIGPRVYGGRLKLSNLAVILAFAVGAAIGGIGGALLALPIAALYPVVERVWLKDYLNRDAVETHQRMQRDSAR